jgi:hypothetical protein
MASWFRVEERAQQNACRCADRDAACARRNLAAAREQRRTVSAAGRCGSGRVAAGVHGRGESKRERERRENRGAPDWQVGSPFFLRLEHRDVWDRPNRGAGPRAPGAPQRRTTCRPSGMDSFARATYHVVPHHGRWAVRRSGARRASGVFATREEAIERAQQLARGADSELVIHGGHGAARGGDRRSVDAPALQQPPR